MNTEFETQNKIYRLVTGHLGDRENRLIDSNFSDLWEAKRYVRRLNEKGARTTTFVCWAR